MTPKEKKELFHCENCRQKTMYRYIFNEYPSVTAYHCFHCDREVIFKKRRFWYEKKLLIRKGKSAAGVIDDRCFKKCPNCKGTKFEYDTIFAVLWLHPYYQRFIQTCKRCGYKKDLKMLKVLNKGKKKKCH